MWMTAAGFSFNLILLLIFVDHQCRTIVALVYNVLKSMMTMNGKLFDDLTNSYKADKQK